MQTYQCEHLKTKLTSNPSI